MAYNLGRFNVYNVWKRWKTIYYFQSFGDRIEIIYSLVYFAITTLKTVLSVPSVGYKLLKQLSLMEGFPSNPL